MGEDETMETTASLSRRDFLGLGATLAAALALPARFGPWLSEGLENLARQKTKVLWIQGQACSGCSVSLLNSENPGPVRLVTELISLQYHSTLGAAQGADCVRIIDQVGRLDDYILVCEGSIPTTVRSACMIAGKTLYERLEPLVKQARYVLALGSCAAFGGIPAAEGNPTGAVGVGEFMRLVGARRRGRLVNAPLCPSHPKSIVGTLVHLAGPGYPDVDPELFTPLMFYRHSTHDRCPRYHDYARKVFASHFGDDHGCLFKLGCLGPLTRTQCPSRQWNGGVNWCIRAAAPCIGCASPDFARRRDFPFYRKGENHHAVDYDDHDRGGANDATP